jgi:exosortase
MSVRDQPAPNVALLFRAHWLLWLGLAAIAIPTIMHLSHETWSTESGAQGPIVLATGGWLIWRQWENLSSDGQSGKLAIILVLLSIAVLSYVFGRAFDFLTAEAAGLYLFGLASAQAFFSGRAVARNWFPFFYLALAVPPPAWLLAQATGPLKHLVSAAAIGTLTPFGIPVAREGVTIFVAQYQLLVEDACSGMNSIIGLLAIGLFYIYVARKASFVYSSILACFIIPIAIAANIIRIVTLVLITYGFGDAVGQGFLHFAAGIFVFVVALLLVFTTDNVLARLLLLGRVRLNAGPA